VQYDSWPPAFLCDLSPSNVFLVPFVMMSKKDSDYISKLSPSVDGLSCILVICALCIMKTSLGMGTSLLSKFDIRSSCGSNLFFNYLSWLSLGVPLSLLHLSLLLLFCI
jgi:hypothetical protein